VGSKKSNTYNLKTAQLTLTKFLQAADTKHRLYMGHGPLWVASLWLPPTNLRQRT